MKKMMDQLFLTESTPPLSEQLRPRNLKEFKGLSDKNNQLLSSWIERQWMPPLLLWGDPGTGKTSLARLLANELHADFKELSATSAGVKELRDIFEQARRKKTILFLDEIHRLNSKQQDVLLPVLEKGYLFFIAATTVDPHHALVSAMRSRLYAIHLKRLSEESLSSIALRAEQKYGKILPDSVISYLTLISQGDGRRFINYLEIVYGLKDIPNDPSELTEILDQKDLSGVRGTESDRYDLVSAWIKSMRASREREAMIYLASLISIKEDPRFLARRLMIFAAEDCLSPEFLSMTSAIHTMSETLGYPEIRIPLCKVTLALARAEKSREGKETIDQALSTIEEQGIQPVPMKLRNNFDESEFLS